MILQWFSQDFPIIFHFSYDFLTIFLWFSHDFQTLPTLSPSASANPQEALPWRHRRAHHEAGAAGGGDAFPQGGVDQGSTGLEMEINKGWEEMISIYHIYHIYIYTIYNIINIIYI